MNNTVHTYTHIYTHSRAHTHTHRVYDDKLDIVQVSQGHTQIINSIIIIPELNQVSFPSVHP